MKKFFVIGIILIKKKTALIRAVTLKLRVFIDGIIKMRDFDSTPRSAPPAFDTDAQDPQV